MKTVSTILLASTLWLTACSAEQMAKFDDHAGDPGVVASAEYVDNVVRGVSPFIPVPFVGEILAGLSGLTLGLVRAAANRRAARAIALGIEVAKDANGTVDLNSKAKVVSTAMGAAGNRIVDEAQGKKAALPF